MPRALEKLEHALREATDLEEDHWKQANQSRAAALSSLQDQSQESEARLLSSLAALDQNLTALAAAQRRFGVVFVATSVMALCSGVAALLIAL